jgi:Fe-S-cluster-containing dehydrogenase component
VDLYDQSVLDTRRRTDAKAYTVINAYPDPKVSFDPTSMGERITVKTQCMHCQEPACASACFVKALEKTSQGPVVYHEDRCVGCRYCMVACPFNMTKFEWDKAIPAIKKCIFCYERQLAGQPPACVEACPAGTLTFGKRKDLLELAKSRIYQNPDQYVHHVYGEHEVGGTSWLYLSSVPFEDVGFRTDLGTMPYPELTKSFLSAVPLVLILWPALLMGCYSFSKQKEQSVGADEVSVEREEV